MRRNPGKLHVGAEVVVSTGALEALLKQAVAYTPQAEILWLMYAKERWLDGDVPGARDILGEAFQANPDSEQIWLAAIKLEAENNEIDRARQIHIKARSLAGTDRIWMKSVSFERQQGHLDEALTMLGEALAKFSKYDKLHMIKGQIHEQRGEVALARQAYAVGVKACPNSVPLWILSSRLEEKAEVTIKARALLEKARLLNPKDAELWAESVVVEERAGSQNQAKAMVARGEYPFACAGTPITH